MHPEATDDNRTFGDASGDDFTQNATIEIALDPELLSCFCRRDRRRLREIQSTCKVVAKLDRRRSGCACPGLLVQSKLFASNYRVCAARIAQVLRSVGRVDADAALQDTADAIVARLQEESGCRIHIE